MIYTPIPNKPGVAGVTLPNGNVTVYYFHLDVPMQCRIEADVTSGVGPIELELHLYTYPATAFTAKNTFIQALMPTGTHYVAVRASIGGVGYILWGQRVVTTCPAGCIATTRLVQVVHEVVHNIHRKNGLPPPTPEDVLEATPAHVRSLATAAADPAVPGPIPRPRTLGIRPPVHVLTVDGSPVSITLTSAVNAVQFVSHISQPGDYEFRVTPAPIAEQELFYLTLLHPDGTIARSSDDGVLAATLTSGSRRLTFEVPRDLLKRPRMFAVSLVRTPVPSQRPGLDHPPFGDGQYAVGSTTITDIAITHPKAQLYGDIAVAGVYTFTCTEVTDVDPGNPQAGAPATLAVYDDDGKLIAEATQPGMPVTTTLAAGRWWVDIVVPDFHQRDTPRRYALRVATDTA